jgi:HK97 family phage prohead protease
MDEETKQETSRAARDAVNRAIKVLGETDAAYTVGGYGVVFGGRDLMGEWFAPDTDFWTDKIAPTPPLLYQHGMDDTLRRAVLGRTVKMAADDVGLWIEAQIDKAQEYAEMVRELMPSLV